MASTAEGRKLTEAHRKAQLAVASRAEVIARRLWSELDVSDLDASSPAWLGANVSAANRFYTESSMTAAAYISEYRVAELGSDIGPLERPGFDASLTGQALNLAGPVRVKLLVGRGVAGDAAHAAALNKFSGMMRRQVLSGGRQMIADTGVADRRAIGWRRVTDGNPCTFCAMLATRGPVYTSKTTALAVEGSGRQYHGGCGCTAEIVYGEWQPSKQEREFQDAYNAVVVELAELRLPRTQQNVMPRLRRTGTFRDSPKTNPVSG